MRTYSPKPADIQREWHVIDATDVVLGRLAVQVATLLRGKHKPAFAPHVDNGDFVIVVNARKVSLAGDKATKKLAYRHSGYPGGLSSTPYGELLEKDPRRAIETSVWGMLPKNRLSRQLMRKLKVYAGPDHPHQAQQAKPFEITQISQASRPQQTSGQRGTEFVTDTSTGVDSGPEETFEVNEQGVAYSSQSAPSDQAPPRPATIAPAAATGRRKEAVARVRLVPGTGEWTVNGRTLDSYFPNKLHQQVVNEPFVTTDLVGRFDVLARIHGGGITGQAGALRLGVARALNAVDLDANRPSLKKAGLLTRDARVIERKKAGLKKARKAPQYSKR